MKKRFIIFTLILPLLLLSACAKDSNALANLSDMELAADQTLITGQVTSRVGNDIELALGTLGAAQGPGSMGDMPTDGSDAMPSFDEGSMPSFDAESMPSGGPGDQGGSRLQGDSQGQMPGGDTSGSTAQDATSQDTTATDGTTATTTGTQIQLSGETMSLTIPVGTRVLVTATDGTLSSSSFGRIQADDIVQMILKTQSDGTQIVTLVQIME